MACILSVMVGCRTITKTVEVPVEKVKTEYLVSNVTKHDSIHDSVYVYFQADTVFVNKFKYIYKYYERLDTIFKDSIVEKPLYITKDVEVNKLYGWQKALMFVGLLAIVYIIFVICKKR